VPSKVEIDTPALRMNTPDVVAEVNEVFLAYEAALLANDIDALNRFFWNSPHTIRYGIGEHNYGFDDICAYRQHAKPVSPSRRLQRIIITTCGRDMACVSTEFVTPGSDSIGRQTQTWVRTEQGWKIVAAHVSELSKN